MKKDNIFKLFIAVYFLIVLIIGFWSMKDLLTKKAPRSSKYEVLDTNLLSVSSKALSKRNYIYNLNINSIDLGSFSFGNPNPFR